MARQMYETQLAAFSPPLGPQPTNPAFYLPQQVTLQMKEKVFSITGDEFVVRTVDGYEVCKCKGKVLSMHNTKIFTDIAGREIFELRVKLLALFKSFNATSPGGHDFSVKGHLSIGTSHSTCEFKNFADGYPVELTITGDWLDRSARIELGGRPVAHISRNFLNARQIFGNAQTYYVTVAPNVDLTMIAALCVCLDEREANK